MCLPISDPIPSDHSASPSTQAYLISHILSHVHIPFQELPTTSVVPTSTSNVGEHSQFNHFFRFSFSSPFPSTHSHRVSDHPQHPPPHLPKRPDIMLSMNDRIPLFPHAHTYISLALRYDTASVRVIFVSILVTFLELDALASTISKHLTIRVYCFFYTHTPRKRTYSS